MQKSHDTDIGDAKVADNVLEFIDKAGALAGKMMAERFSQEVYGNCLDMGMSSPIEHLFWIAAKALCDSEYHTINPDLTPTQKSSGEWIVAPGQGIYIKPQYRVDKYRVDFLIYQIGIGPSEHLGPVIVELDGHDFHDKDKRQRSYEKARDRFLVKKGYRVLHFTGSDVVADPFKVAYEALEMVGCFLVTCREGYNKNDPLGIGV